MKVYAFEYTDCIYESACAVVSLHSTKKGAYTALKKDKFEAYREWMNNTRWYRAKYKFGAFENWRIREIEVEP